MKCASVNLTQEGIHGQGNLSYNSFDFLKCIIIPKMFHYREAFLAFFFFMISKNGNYECHENTLSSCILLTIEPLYECVLKLALHTFPFPRNQRAFSNGVDTRRDCFLLIVALYQSSFQSQLDHLSFGTIPTYYYMRYIYTDLYILRHVHGNSVKRNF